MTTAAEKLMQNLLILVLILLSRIDLGTSISCYKCLSVNGSNPLCEDQFQGDITGKPSFLVAPCLTHLRGRTGLFPATHCIKLVAYSKGPNPVQYMYRTCGRDEAEENGITRASHCGFVKLNWIDSYRRFRGCLDICDKDACNHCSIFSVSKVLVSSTIVLVFLRRKNSV